MAATTSSAEKGREFIGTLDETPERGNFDAPGHLLSFRARRTKVTQQKQQRRRRIFSIQASGDWQRAFKLGSRQKHSQINPINRISSDGFPRAS
jgi:hypothetical protein